MKKEFSVRPEAISEAWCKACYTSWYDMVTAIPSPVFLVTGWKANGRENACLQSWTAFVRGGVDDFICIMGSVFPGGHMYQSIKETGVCVLNFPSRDIYDRCIRTIGNNGPDTDEITAAGLTAEKAARVNAPRVRECFLNIECEFLWEHPLCEGRDEMTVALRAVSICMDEDRFDQGRLGRYGRDGYLFQVDQPVNPQTGEISPISAGTFAPGEPFPWETK